MPYKERFKSEHKFISKPIGHNFGHQLNALFFNEKAPKSIKFTFRESLHLINLCCKSDAIKRLSGSFSSDVKIYRSE